MFDQHFLQRDVFADTADKQHGCRPLRKHFKATLDAGIAARQHDDGIGFYTGRCWRRGKAMHEYGKAENPENNGGK